jgi:hypothetical protein
MESLNENIEKLRH